MEYLVKIVNEVKQTSLFRVFFSAQFLLNVALHNISAIYRYSAFYDSISIHMWQLLRI